MLFIVLAGNPSWHWHWNAYRHRYPQDRLAWQCVAAHKYDGRSHGQQ